MFDIRVISSCIPHFFCAFRFVAGAFLYGGDDNLLSGLGVVAKKVSQRADIILLLTVHTQVRRYVLGWRVASSQLVMLCRPMFQSILISIVCGRRKPL